MNTEPEGQMLPGPSAILYVRGITCRRTYVEGLISMVNSIYNGSRFEDVWLDN
jgi:hypothetical protein